MSLRLLITDATESLQFRVINENEIDTGDPAEINSTERIKYAILSHRWRQEEVEYSDRTDITNARQKRGWAKLEDFRSIAARDGYKYVWMDTCCIDKSSSTELAEALNSMFRWYQLADTCYAYLDDVQDAWSRIVPADLPPVSQQPDASNQSILNSEQRVEAGQIELQERQAQSHEEDGQIELQEEWTQSDVESAQFELQEQRTAPVQRSPSGRPESQYLTAFHRSEWFKRGWTLQEMIAPQNLVFYDANWKTIGPLREIAEAVANASGVNKELLMGRRPLQSYSIAQKLSWAASRKTTRVEDRAYSLLGILDVSMSVIYGEGTRAFQRLQEELLRTSSDTTIFAWPGNPSTDPGKLLRNESLLAESPEAFQYCGELRPLPSAHQRAIHQVIGSHIQFHTPFLKGQAVICCLDSDVLRVVVLKLRAVTDANDSYIVSGLDGRTGIEDIHTAATAYKTSTLSVWRSVNEAQKVQEDHRQHTILCRCMLTSSAETCLQIKKAEPDWAWNRRQQAFVLEYADNQHERPPFDGTVTLSIDDTAPSIKICLHRTSRGSLQIRWPLPTWILGEPHIRSWLLNSRLPLRPFAMVWTPENRLMTMRRGEVVFVRLGKWKLLHLQSDVLEVKLVSVDSAALICVKWILESILVGVAHILVFSTVSSPIFLTGVVPIIAIMLVRDRQYNDPMGTSAALSFTETAVLYPGLLIVWLPFVLLYIGILGVRTRGMGPIERLRTATRSLCHLLMIRLRSWYICAVNITSIVLCALYLPIAQAHYAAIDRYNLYDNDAGADMAQEKPAINAVIARVVFCAIMLLLAPTKTDLWRFAASFGIAIVMIQYGIATSSIVAPWTDDACTSGNITQTATNFYFTYALSTASDQVQICQDFATESKLLWTIAMVALMESILALLTFPFTERQQSPIQFLSKVQRFISQRPTPRKIVLALFTSLWKEIKGVARAMYNPSFD